MQRTALLSTITNSTVKVPKTMNSNTTRFFHITSGQTGTKEYISYEEYRGIGHPGRLAGEDFGSAGDTYIDITPENYQLYAKLSDTQWTVWPGPFTTFNAIRHPLYPNRVLHYSLASERGRGPGLGWFPRCSYKLVHMHSNTHQVIATVLGSQSRVAAPTRKTKHLRKRERSAAQDNSQKMSKKRKSQVEMVPSSDAKGQMDCVTSKTLALASPSNKNLSMEEPSSDMSLNISMNDVAPSNIVTAIGAWEDVASPLRDTTQLNICAVDSTVSNDHVSATSALRLLSQPSDDRLQTFECDLRSRGIGGVNFTAVEMLLRTLAPVYQGNASLLLSDIGVGRELQVESSVDPGRSGLGTVKDDQDEIKIGEMDLEPDLSFPADDAQSGSPDSLQTTLVNQMSEFFDFDFEPVDLLGRSSSPALDRHPKSTNDDARCRRPCNADLPPEIHTKEASNITSPSEPVETEPEAIQGSNAPNVDDVTLNKLLTSEAVPCIENDAELSSRPEYPRPPPVTTDDGEEFFIRDIIDERRVGRGYRYLVRWVGYGPEDDQWLPRSELEDTEALDIWLAKKQVN